MRIVATNCSVGQPQHTCKTFLLERRLVFSREFVEGALVATRKQWRKLLILELLLNAVVLVARGRH